MAKLTRILYQSGNRNPPCFWMTTVLLCIYLLFLSIDIRFGILCFRDLLTFALRCLAFDGTPEYRVGGRTKGALENWKLTYLLTGHFDWF